MGVIGVNVMVAMTNFADMIKTSISEKVDIIIAGAGFPLDLPSFLKKGQSHKTGSDSFICQGCENNL